MNRYKICVYAICKNESKFVDRWMDAVSEADIVVVSDTGSSDDTVEKLLKRGAMVYTDIQTPFRFDAARNAALSHVPGDVDICVSNDLDEVFEPHWREKLENAWQADTTRARYTFTWSQNGEFKKQFAMEKIHSPKVYRWIRPVHEVLEYVGDAPEKVVWVPEMVLCHMPDNTKARGQYLPLLELSAKENPDDDRVAFWLGREYMYSRDYDACIEKLSQYLKMPTALWPEERSAAMRFISECYKAKRDAASAKRWGYLALAECPLVREPYLYMARLGYETGDWPLVLMMAEHGLKIQKPSGSYLVEPACWGYALYDLGAIACYRLGLFEKAEEYAKEALQKLPGDARLQNNLGLIREKLKDGGAGDA